MALRELILKLVEEFLPAVPAPAVATIESGRPMSDSEAMARIRNLLSDRRFKYRKLGTIASAIGRTMAESAILIDGMNDVRGSRGNYRRTETDRLYTFASAATTARLDDKDVEDDSDF